MEILLDVIKENPWPIGIMVVLIVAAIWKGVRS